MRTILSCDAVFDVLTRAPFPDSGSDSESVEAHLSVCHECRCLAEALRPAIGLCAWPQIRGPSTSAI